ncbi:protein translocase subunit SecD [Gammaproteobacteria bacterium]|nr:protein translocase subunit SecD [Gammaproteobacteria bacterium]
MQAYPYRSRGLALLIALLISGIYVLPNVFGEKPALRLSPRSENSSIPTSINQRLVKINHQTIVQDNKQILVFDRTEDQSAAMEQLKPFSEQINTTLSWQDQSPPWLQALGAKPMNLGLDLRGGVHFLLKIDDVSIFKSHLVTDKKNLVDLLHLKQKQIELKANNKLMIHFDNKPSDTLMQSIQRNFQNLSWEYYPKTHTLTGTIQPHVKQSILNYAVSQTVGTLDQRINELGVAEAVIQRQGPDQISVDLPGIQDINQAKSLLGKTATLAFHLVDTQATQQTSHLKWLAYRDQQVPLKEHSILTGDAITFATAVWREGRPAVNIQVATGPDAKFQAATANNIGQPLAVIYIETALKKNAQGKLIQSKKEKIINIATIQSPLSNQFDITGLNNYDIAKQLAMQLRSGAMPAPLAIVEEATIGPSLGQENIQKGLFSLLFGATLILIFMPMYYRLFGLFANLAILANVVLLLACLSWIHATLTLPGIAGIVLTVGMAVDANVLINERIREELRNGLNMKLAIEAGYQRAFATIMDANVTTLIVALILFGFGSGSVKGFAVTLTIGLIASVLTAVTLTRCLVEWYQSRWTLEKSSIGIK